VAESLFRKATTDGAQSVTAAIFWLKTRGGWRESPQSHQVEMGVRRVSEMSDQELMRIMGIADTSITREQASVTARRIIEADPLPR
jgi:hypothetical protein